MRHPRDGFDIRKQLREARLQAVQGGDLQETAQGVAEDGKYPHKLGTNTPGCSGLVPDSERRDCELHIVMTCVPAQALTVSSRPAMHDCAGC